MRRWATGLLMVSYLSIFASSAPGAQRREPRRYQRSTFSEYIVKPKSLANPNPRLVYRGYVQGFPPPAMFYYGYPHSGDGTSSLGF